MLVVAVLALSVVRVIVRHVLIALLHVVESALVAVIVVQVVVGVVVLMTVQEAALVVVLAVAMVAVIVVLMTVQEAALVVVLVHVMAVATDHALGPVQMIVRAPAQVTVKVAAQLDALHAMVALIVVVAMVPAQSDVTHHVIQVLMHNLVSSLRGD